MPRGLEVEIKQRGAAQAALHVRGLGERAADPRPAFNRIGRDLQQTEAAWFQSGGAGQWPPLALATEEQKAAAGLGHEPLVATGRLRRSLLSRSATTIDARAGELRFGTDVPYARFHEYGTRTMPKRPPVLPASPRLRQRMTEEVRKHIVEGGR